MKRALPILFTLLFSCSTLSGTGAVDFSTLAAGTHAAGISGRVSESFSDPASFEAFWKMVSAGTVPEPTAPAVDFSTDMVIAVSPGPMPTGGYDVTIRGVADTGAKIVVRVAVTEPTGFVTMALTQPYQIIRITKTALPIEYVWELRSSDQCP
jgi:hypothetical protein